MRSGLAEMNTLYVGEIGSQRENDGDQTKDFFHDCTQ
jgi:hypothetical protein